jgi:hypothetical protein
MPPVKVPIVGGVITSRSGSSTRHLLFHATDWDLDLFLSREDGRISVIGQVLPSDVRNMPSVFNAVAVLTENGVFVETTSLAANGEFIFQNVPDGELQLELFLNSMRMTVSFRP